MSLKKIESALISVYYKEGLDRIVKLLDAQGVKIYSTGGTQKFIEELNIKVTSVDDVTGFPEILGGRVKTLQPQIFGGILYRRDNESDQNQVKQHNIPPIDLVIVDLYPFEETVANTSASEQDIIEKIDIGGISLIRAGAKNFKDVLIVSSREQYSELATLLEEKNCSTEIGDRKSFAAKAFDMSSHYDSAIFNYFNQEQKLPVFKESVRTSQALRYGENPHQKGWFYGNMDQIFEKLNGKELSYNNLLDVEAAVALMDEFEDTTFVIIKHNNPCGLASAPTAKDAYLKALACDPVSAFGGVIITNTKIDLATAEELHKLFFEIVIAPSYEKDALDLLNAKKNRIILVRKTCDLPVQQFKSLLNGVLVQDRDLKMVKPADLKVVTKVAPTSQEIKDLIYANKIVKHTKSNTIVFAKDGQLIASGVGQTSRVDALKQAIEKAKGFGFSIEGSAMASDAFFPFPDCVEIALNAGVRAVIQPGGSIKDQESIDFCDKNGMTMVLTGLRHFKH
ncbi:MAG: bifunctional phosphoribosylaminoimidazolecarboxamide formyltransferase/IMP cyclohydrolase [Opitutaceae bacterium]|nr:bifunctional phosphoribosylaminoimidazolecarboxamide formyltransferase/IMP cyclohydrolase [Cytophagales bacterium]